MKIVLLTVFNSILMLAGQVLWKTGMSKRCITSVTDIFLALFSPYIIIGIAVYVLATFLWLYILNKADLSYVYPIQSLAFVFSLIFASLIFEEDVSLNRWIGVGVICAGVWIVSMK